MRWRPLASLCHHGRMLAERAQAADQIADGNLDIEVRSRSDRDTLARSYTRVLDTLRRLVAESRKLSVSAVDGHLNQRGESAAFQGGYRDIVDGFNRTLDAVVEPVNEAAAIIARIAQKDLTARVEGQYRGDHAVIKNNINRMARGSAHQHRPDHPLGRRTRLGRRRAHRSQPADVLQRRGTSAQANSSRLPAIRSQERLGGGHARRRCILIREIAQEFQRVARWPSAPSSSPTTPTSPSPSSAIPAPRSAGDQGHSPPSPSRPTARSQRHHRSARAGEAGRLRRRPNEVKELQADRQGPSIGQKIEASRPNRRRLRPLRRSAHHHPDLDISNNIASAVEEQTSPTTRSPHVTEPPRHRRDRRNIAGVAEAAKDTSQGSSQTEKAASALSPWPANSRVWSPSTASDRTVSEHAPRPSTSLSPRAPIAHWWWMIPPLSGAGSPRLRARCRHPECRTAPDGQSPEEGGSA